MAISAGHLLLVVPAPSHLLVPSWHSSSQTPAKRGIHQPTIATFKCYQQEVLLGCMPNKKVRCIYSNVTSTSFAAAHSHGELLQNIHGYLDGSYADATRPPDMCHSALVWKSNAEEH